MTASLHIDDRRFEATVRMTRGRRKLLAFQREMTGQAMAAEAATLVSVRSLDLAAEAAESGGQ